MSEHKQIMIEGYTPEEILSLPDELIEGFVFCNEPVAFTAGTAEILGEFSVTADSLVVELAHIDGGGEGVLPMLWVLAERYAKKRELEQVEWIVHAVNCARPNLKLRRALERKGFAVKNVEAVGEMYHLIHRIQSA